MFDHLDCRWVEILLAASFSLPRLTRGRGWGWSLLECFHDRTVLTVRFECNLVCVVVVEVVVVLLLLLLLLLLVVLGVDRLGGVGVAGQTVAARHVHWRRSHVEAALSLTGLEQLLAGVVVDITLVGQLLVGEGEELVVLREVGHVFANVVVIVGLTDDGDHVLAG